ncbi:hypothetical protein AB0J35_57015, partial [Nonomuraea angiospora]|uniref:hypothetical protein n=1 Tax=Nonomuraea angiospora TaxID=46172 RepID=UPI0034488FA8
MAWEWVAPVVTGVSGLAGVIFTWLAGSQSRQHAERMVEHNRVAEEQARLFKERRDAYLAALRYIDLVRRRADYKSHGQHDKLQLFDEQWPRTKRIEMEIDTLIALRAFGSERVLELAAEWIDAHLAEHRDAAAQVAQLVLYPPDCCAEQGFDRFADSETALSDHVR